MSSWGKMYFDEFAKKNKKIKKKDVALELQTYLNSKNSDVEYLLEVSKFNKKYKDFDLDYYPSKADDLIQQLDSLNPQSKDFTTKNLDLFYTLIVQKYKL